MAKSKQTANKGAIKDGKGDEKVPEPPTNTKTKKGNTKGVKPEKPNEKYVSNLRKSSVRESVPEDPKVIRKKKPIPEEISSESESEDIAPKKKKNVSKRKSVEENVTDSSEEEPKKPITKKKTVRLGVRGAEKKLDVPVASSSTSSEEEVEPQPEPFNLSAEIDDIIKKYSSGSNKEDNEAGGSGETDEVDEESPQNVESTDDEESDEFSKIGYKDSKTRKKWPAKLEQKLCKLWEEEDHLYDATCKTYRRSHLRAAAFTRFAAILKMDANDIKVHMDSLRTVYKKIINLPSGSSSDRLTPRQKEICELCKFLRRHLQNCETQSNVDKPSKRGRGKKDDDESSEQLEPPTKKGKFTSKTKPKGGRAKKSDQVSDDDADSTDLDNKTPAYYVNSKNKKNLEAKKKQVAREAQEKRTDLLTDLTSSVSSLVQSNVDKGREEPPDSHEIWAKLLAIKIREMDKKVAERFKIHVDTIALDAVEGEWQKK